MSREIVPAGWVTVRATGLLPRRHRLYAGRRPLGDLFLGLGPAVLYSDVRGWQAYLNRTSLVRPEYRMRADGEELTARFRPLQADVLFGDRRFLLHAVSRHDWRLRDFTGEPVLTVYRGGWGRMPRIEVHKPAEVALLVFVYYLVLMYWRAERVR